MNFRWDYLLYVLGFIVLLIVLGEMNYYLDSRQQSTYNVYPWSLLAMLTYLPIGMYLGLPLLIKEFKKTGKWRVNVQKLILIGLPSLYLALSWLLPLFIPAFLVHSHRLLSFGGIIAMGYILIVSFTKESK